MNRETEFLNSVLRELTSLCRYDCRQQLSRSRQQAIGSTNNEDKSAFHGYMTKLHKIKGFLQK